jgi:hypothetical protein
MLLSAFFDTCVYISVVFGIFRVSSIICTTIYFYAKNLIHNHAIIKLN